MRMLTGIMLIGGLLSAASLATAQRPGGGPEANLTKSADADDLVARMMEFDKDKDGKLSKAEVTDERLHRLFDRSDANKDGIVTKEELFTLAAKEHADDQGGPRGFGPPGGPGGPMMGFPRPGEILPARLQQALRLTSEQKTQLEDLQKEVDAKLEKILDDAQRTQLKEMRERGPGAFGPPGGGRRPGGPGGGAPPGGGPPPRPNSAS
jgi:hypothetical protein